MDALKNKEWAWAQGRGWVWAVSAVVGVVWLLAGAADWFMRFAWFRWQQRIIFKPAAIAAVARGAEHFVTNWIPESRGGDLTRLAGIRSFAGRFEQPRPAGVNVYDAAGFRNFAGPPDLAHPVVVVGDSFMAAGEPMTNMFSARLTELSGRPAYNRAMLGVGSFLSMVRFVDSERFKSRPPKWVIWGFIEREISRSGFASLYYQLQIREKGIVPADHLELRAQKESLSPMISWRELKPAKLKQSLPDTSALAQASRRAWNQLRYYLLGMIDPAVVVSEGLVNGRPLLFYRPALRVEWPDPLERDTVEIAWLIRQVRDYLAQRGVGLVVVMIPDKERVYQELIPAHAWEGREPWPSLLGEIEDRVRADHIPVVNLLPIFRERAARGELLYWPDDTHWNEKGILVAAEETWSVIADTFEPDP